MSNKLKQIFKLLPVRTAPFFALGIVLCSMGGTLSVIFILAAVLLSAAAFRFRRELFASALALLLGMTAVSAHILFVCRPLETYAGTSQRLTLYVTECYNGSGYSYCRCSTFVGGRLTELTFYSDTDCSAGDIIDAQVGLTALTYRRSESRPQILKGNIDKIFSHERPAFSLRRSIAEFRTELQQEITGYISGDAGALAQGLLFGDTDDFSSELYHAAKISGVVHFTAVSGSHFVIIMAVLLELAGRHKRLRSVLALICVPLAVLFFGTDPSVIRAGIMVFLCNCGPLFSRKAETINSLCAAVLIMTMFTPYIMLDIGFQMSVLGVFGVSVVGPRIARMLRRYTHKLPELLRGAVDALTISACAVICIAPVSVAAFGGASLTGVFATLVLTPVFTAALTLAVIFAVTGLTPLLVPISLLMHAAYHIIMFFGCDSRLWLTLDFSGAWIFALISAASITVAAVFFDEKHDIAVSVFAVSIAAAVGLSFISSSARRKIEFVSDGTSGAALICIKSEATIILCGSGADSDVLLADRLLRNGSYSIRYINAQQLSENGAAALISLEKMYHTEHIDAASDVLPTLSEHLHETQLSACDAGTIAIDGITIATAKSGDIEVCADIVMYYSYKMSEPAHNATLPLYVSSRQDILPENGINIYDEPYEIKLRKPEK